MEYWLREVALEYHRRTEIYDQRTCQFKNERGIAIPTSSLERTLCTRHARGVLKELVEKNGGTSNGHKIQSAISNYAQEAERMWLSNKE